MSTLDKAIRIAAEVHEGQKDRYGSAYILHPIRVMMRVDSEVEKIAAILHDVVEDSDWTLGDLQQEGFSEEVVTAVDCLTRRDEQNEPYMDYIDRVLTNPPAITVKLADLEDNMDLTRIAEMDERDPARMVRYHEAWKKLQKNVNRRG